jgi:hypothetical protein
MTCRRETKRRRLRQGAVAVTKSGLAPALCESVTEEEIAVLEEMRQESSFPAGESQLFTLPGCDRPAHRQHIQSLLVAAAMGQPSTGSGFYRMRCGCALLIHGQLTWERF